MNQVPGIGTWVMKRMKSSPNKTAFIDGDDKWTYSEFADLVTTLANHLESLGVSQGSRVVYLGPNSIQVPALLFASAQLGAIYLPLNTRLTAPEISYILNDSRPNVFVWHNEHDSVVQELTSALEGVRRIRVTEEELPEEEGVLDFNLWIREPRAPVITPEVDGDSPVMIQYTSGTSGRPKGVMLTHSNITWNSINLLIETNVGTDEVSIVAAPLFHTAGLNNHLLPIFMKGGTSILVRSWRPSEVIEMIQRYRVTSLLGVPTMFLRLMQEPRWAEADVSSLRTLMCGGSPVPPALARDYLERGLVFQTGYGLTETSPNATFVRADMARQKTESVGPACFFVDVKIVDGTGNSVANGETGEVLIKGPNVTPGYWERPDATAAAFTEDGWFMSGDMGYLDEDEYVYISDRKKDMIISGGENIYPAEVEAAIYEHPGIKECAVIGRPDERWGESGVAFIVTVPGESIENDELLDFLRGRLAKYKIPKDVVHVDSLPHTASGKVLKRELRELVKVQSLAVSSEANESKNDG